MKILCLDFETYFDTADFTLKKLTTEEYVRDARFHIHGCAVAWYGERPVWLNRQQFEQWAATFPWHEHGAMAFHAQFDGLILSHVYNAFPRFWFDPMAMARGMWGKQHGFSLDAISAYLGMTPKRLPYELFNGKLWSQIPDGDRAQIADGCCHDAWLMQQLFHYFGQTFPREEYRIIDQTVRMFTEPVLQLDLDLLASIWTEEAAKHAANLQALADKGITLTDLRSDKKFRVLLEAAGVDIEFKYSRTDNKKLIPAFSKTDGFLTALEDDPDDYVATLATARLDSRSNINQSRAERLGYMANRGTACIYLSYCPTRTTRWGGGDKLNWQNFPRSRRSDGRINRLRQTVCAPRGYLLLRPDLSQIECRILNYNAGEVSIVQAFREKRDLYSELASVFYGFAVDKTMETHRGFGKQLELSCGYGAGEFSIQRTARSGGYGPPVFLSSDDAVRARDTYRETHPNVVRYWKQASKVLEWLFEGAVYDWGPLRVADHKIWLPNGLPLVYDTLEWFNPDDDPDDEDHGLGTVAGNWRVQVRPRQWKKLYGSALVAEVTQAQARVVLSQALLRILDRFAATGTYHRVCLSTHDDLAILVKEDEAQAVAEVVIEELIREPEWLPGIPLAAECAISNTLSKDSDNA